MSESKYVTLANVAAACGVTTTTASLALRNHPRISEATKEKIRSMAEKINYQRNPMISALMAKLNQSGRLTTVVPLAVVYTHKAPMIESNSFHKKVLLGMNRRAHELGYKLECFYIDQQAMTGKRLTEILRARGISGVLIPPLSIPGGHLNLIWKSFSIIAIGYSMLAPDVHRVCPNQYQGIRLTLRELKHFGYKRPGLILNKRSDQRTIHLWSSGFYGYEHAEKRRSIVPVLECNDIGKSDLFEKWFTKYKPDVIISSDLEVVTILQEVGLKTPQDVGFATLSRWEPGGEFAGIDQNEEAVGAAAVEQLVQSIYYNERGVPQTPRTVQIPPVWREGKSIIRQSNH